MKKFAIVLGAAILSAGLAPAVAMADEAAASAAVEVKRGDMLYTGDGKRVGNVYRVTGAGDAQLIYRGKMITVPANTLSSADGKLSTSLSLDEVRKLG
jgi:hypothetical protein